MTNIIETENRLKSKLQNVRQSCLESGFYFLRHPSNLPPNQVLREYKDRLELWEITGQQSVLINTLTNEEAAVIYNYRS